MAPQATPVLRNVCSDANKEVATGDTVDQTHAN